METTLLMVHMLNVEYIQYGVVNPIPTLTWFAFTVLGRGNYICAPGCINDSDSSGKTIAMDSWSP